jgi:hypothetical protein
MWRNSGGAVMKNFRIFYRCLILSIFVIVSAGLFAQESQEASHKTQESNKDAQNSNQKVEDSDQQVQDTNEKMVDGKVILTPMRHPGAKSPSFTLSIRGGDVDGPRDEFKAGSSVVIMISMTNITKHNIHYSSWYWHNLLDEYKYFVWDEDGKPVEPKSFGDPDLSTSSMYWSGISPGKTETYAAEISGRYKFDRPGKYTIQVMRPDPDYLDENKKPVMIKSNIITIRITG